MTGSEGASGGDLGADIIALSALIDSGYPEDLDPESHRWRRCVKVSEEAGEVIEALLGAVGENPRKGTTHTLEQVQHELLDVALAALGAVAHLNTNSHQPSVDPIALLAAHASRVRARLQKVIDDPVYEDEDEDEVARRRCIHDPDSGEPKGECPCGPEGCGRDCPCADEDVATTLEATVIRVGRLAGSQKAARELCAEVQKGTPVVLDFRDNRSAAPSFVGALLFYATVPPDNTNPVEVVGASPEVVEAAEAWIAQSGRVVAETVTFR